MHIDIYIYIIYKDTFAYIHTYIYTDIYIQKLGHYWGECWEILIPYMEHIGVQHVTMNFIYNCSNFADFARQPILSLDD